MSQRANPTLIGAFVIGAIALLVAGLLVLGSGHYGGDRETLVLYFRYSTTGLKVGAPVVLKGVQIGVVQEIQVAYDDASGRFLVPVYIEIDQSRVQWPGEIRGELDKRELYQRGLEAGLRARLGLQSLVTGMLQVEVAFFPGTKLVLYGGDSRYRELPTIRSPFERLLGQVENVPVERLIQEALAIMEGLNRLVNAQEVESILANLDTGAANLARVGAGVSERIGPTGDRLDVTLDEIHGVARILSTKLDGLLAAVEQAADGVNQLARNTNVDIGPLAKDLRKAGNSAANAFASAEGAFDTVSSAVNQRSSLYRESITALRSFSKAAESLRSLADYLERHPEALIRGKR